MMNAVLQSTLWLGPLVLLLALVSLPLFYLRYRKAAVPKQPLSVVRYIFMVLVSGVLGAAIGMFTGISMGCGQEQAGNLCGLMGVLGVGPMFSGVAMIFAARRLTHRALS